DVGHFPVGDEHGWAMFRQQPKRLAAILGNNHCVWFSRKTVFDQPSIDRGIVRNHNLRVLQGRLLRGQLQPFSGSADILVPFSPSEFDTMSIRDSQSQLVSTAKPE